MIVLSGGKTIFILSPKLTLSFAFNKTLSFKIPTIGGFKISHNDEKITLPIGRIAKIERLGQTLGFLVVQPTHLQFQLHLCVMVTTGAVL